MSKENCFALNQIQGQREYQEDLCEILTPVILPDKQTGILLILCDGMGGAAGGEEASKLVCRRFREAFASSELAMHNRLKFALETTHQIVIEYTENHPQYREMGTTLIAVCVTEQKLYWISVGDSPLWLLRDGQLQRLNADHSMAPIFAKMVEMGELSEEEAASDPKRHALRSLISRGKIKEVDVTDDAFDLQIGDQILLASDGIETLTDEQIVQVLLNEKHTNSEQALDHLLLAVEAEEKPEQDNASAILYRVEAENATDESIYSKNNGAKKKPGFLATQPGKGILLISLIFLLGYLFKGGDKPPSTTSRFNLLLLECQPSNRTIDLKLPIKDTPELANSVFRQINTNSAERTVRFKAFLPNQWLGVESERELIPDKFRGSIMIGSNTLLVTSNFFCLPNYREVNVVDRLVIDKLTPPVNMQLKGEKGRNERVVSASHVTPEKEEASFLEREPDTLQPKNSIAPQMTEISQ